MMKEEIAKATSFALSTGTPMIFAAVSWSRTAMKSRPAFTDTSRQASAVSSTTTVSAKS